MYAIRSYYGTDIRRLAREFREQYPEFNDIPVVPVSTPDFVGCLESGYALAVKAIVEYVVPEDTTKVGKRKKQVNVLASSMLTPGDLEHINRITSYNVCYTKLLRNQKERSSLFLHDWRNVPSRSVSAVGSGWTSMKRTASSDYFAH